MPLRFRNMIYLRAAICAVESDREFDGWLTIMMVFPQWTACCLSDSSLSPLAWAGCCGAGFSANVLPSCATGRRPLHASCRRRLPGGRLGSMLLHDWGWGVAADLSFQASPEPPRPFIEMGRARSCGPYCVRRAAALRPYARVRSPKQRRTPCLHVHIVADLEGHAL